MIAGLEEISKGELYIGDVLSNDIAPKDRDIAMVFQNYALYPHMTVFDNMAFGLKLRKTPKDEIKRRVEEAARILDISHLLDRKPKALSGGQRQRVALGRAIVRDPKVFLLDEPLSNLDAKLRAQMRTEIAKLHKRLGTTFIYVTHDQTEAMTMGDRIVVMKDGFIPAGRYSSEPVRLPHQRVRGRLHGFSPDELHRCQAGQERQRLHPHLRRLHHHCAQEEGRRRLLPTWPITWARMLCSASVLRTSTTSPSSSRRLAALTSPAMWKLPN